MARYLLPCSCGQQVEVEARQAGLQVACRCGKKLDVPTLRGLKELPLVGDSQQDAAAQASTWGPRQGITFLGVVVLLCGVAGAGVLWVTWPPFQTPDFEKFRQESRDAAAQMDPLQALTAWEGMQKEGFNRNPNPQLRHYEERAAAHTRWLIASGILAGVGAIMAGAALASGKGAPGQGPLGKPSGKGGPFGNGGPGKDAPSKGAPNKGDWVEQAKGKTKGKGKGSIRKK